MSTNAEKKPAGKGSRGRAKRNKRGAGGNGGGARARSASNASKSSRGRSNSAPRAKAPATVFKQKKKVGLSFAPEKDAAMLATSIGLDDTTKNEVAMAGYFGGFIDPDFAGRGPSSDNEPTIVATFRARTSMQIAAPIPGGTTSWPDTTYTPYFANGGNSIGICVTPTYWVKQTPIIDDPDGTVVDAAPVSGFTFDPDNQNPSTPLVTKAPAVFGANQVRPWPLANFTSGFPGVPGKIYSPNLRADDDSKPEKIAGESYRLTGLRATLTITQAALTSQGNVVCGDLETFHAVNTSAVNRYGSGVNVAGAKNYVQPIFDVYDDDMYRQAINDGSRDVRLKQAGAFTHGQIYEATWLPTDDDSLEFRDTHMTIVPPSDPLDPFHIKYINPWPYTNMASIAINQGAVVFLLKDLVLPASVVVNVTCAYEVGVRAHSSPIGFLINQARFARRYVVDWDLLQQLPTGGVLGNTYKSWIAMRRGALHQAMKDGKVPMDVSRVPTNYGVGAITPTARVTMTQVVTKTINQNRGLSSNYKSDYYK
jgi:hypothetical protein